MCCLQHIVIYVDVVPLWNTHTQYKILSIINAIPVKFVCAVVASYPEVQIHPHVLKETAHHCGQMNDMGRLMLLEYGLRLLLVPEERPG